MLVSPSIIAADFTRLKEEIKEVEDGGADRLHLDIMDGVFVSNITFGPMIVEAIDKMTDLHLEAHLMLIDPLKYIDAFADAGAETIIFHIESKSKPRLIMQKIRDRKLKIGVSLNPDTPIRTLFPYIEEIDLILVMSVNPGFYGQKFEPKILPKLKKLKEIKEKGNLNFEIEIDGGINKETAPIVAPYVDILVSGAYIFKSRDRKAIIKNLKNLC